MKNIWKAGTIFSIRAVNGRQTVMQKDSIEVLHQYWGPLVQEACLSIIIIIIIVIIIVLPVSDIASRRHLRSASRRHLLVPRHNLFTYGRRAFSVAGPAAWNSLCDELHEPSLAAVSFRQLLKTRLFAEY